MPVKVSLKRRLIYVFAFLIFVASSVLMTFFAFGYRFSFKNGIFIHSGTITIKSTPKKVNIYLNGKEIDNKSSDIINDSYNINGVKPGLYILEVKSPGYQTWKKKVIVHSGISTEFWNILLAQENPSQTRLDILNPSFYEVAEGGENIVYANKITGTLNIFLYSTKKETALKIFEEPSNRKDTASLEFSKFTPDKKSLILELKEGNFFRYYLAFSDRIEKEGINSKSLVDLNPQLKRIITSSAQQDKKEFSVTLGQKETGLFQTITSGKNETSDNSNGAFKITQEIKQFEWIDNDNLYFLYRGNLYLLTLSKETITLVLNDIRGYALSRDSILFLKGPDNLVFKSNRNGLDIKQITENAIGQDPNNTNPYYKIIAYDDKRMAFINQNKELYLFNNNSKEHQPLKKIGDNITKVQFSDDGKKLLYFSDKEIKVYYLREWDVQPKNDVGANITVFDAGKDSILDALWYENYQWIIFSTGKTIRILELDSRDQVNDMKVVESNVSNPRFSYDAKKKTLYFLSLSDKYVQLFYAKFPQE